MNPWTDMDALCAAIRRTKSKAEAAALIATWRAPRAKQLPLKMAVPESSPVNDTMTPAQRIEASRAVVLAIESNIRKATP